MTGHGSAALRCKMNGFKMDWPSGGHFRSHSRCYLAIVAPLKFYDASIPLKLIRNSNSPMSSGVDDSMRLWANQRTFYAVTTRRMIIGVIGLILIRQHHPLVGLTEKTSKKRRKPKNRNKQQITLNKLKKKQKKLKIQRMRFS